MELDQSLVKSFSVNATSDLYTFITTQNKFKGMIKGIWVIGLKGLEHENKTEHFQVCSFRRYGM